MKEFESNLALSDAELDRLVDGELSAADLRAIVRRIESSADGWKRCATAYMEAQAWREALRDDRRANLAVPTPKQNTWTRPVSWLAVAAAVVLAFSGGRWSQSGDAQPLRFAGNEGFNHDMHIAEGAVGVRTLGQVVWPSQGSIAVRGVPSMQITIYEGVGIDDHWCNALPSVVPDLVAKQLERQGCKVREERRLLPLSLADGRRLALRVDQVHFTLTGRPSVL